MVTVTADVGTRANWLLCRAAGRACGLPLEAVLLTLRRPALDSWGEGHAVVDGVATIRGEVVPVLSLGQLVSGDHGEPALGGERDATESRLVLLAVAGRRVALAVSEIIGVKALPATATSELPPLLKDAHATHVARLGALDGELLLLLRTGRLLAPAPEDAAGTEGQT